LDQVSSLKRRYSLAQGKVVDTEKTALASLLLISPGVPS
jgi:hypothetical protein